MRVATTLFATDAGKSGLSVYVKCLYEALLRHPGVRSVSFYGPPGSEAWLPQTAPGGAELRHIPVTARVNGRAANVLWHQTAMVAELLFRERPDVVHFPVANRRVAWVPGIPTVGTVHDLGELKVAAKYDMGRMLYLRRVVVPLLRSLRRIVAISRSTLDDLRLALGGRMPPAQIIAQGVDARRFRPLPKDEARGRVRAGIGIEGPYILYPARLEHPAKNHVRLIEAFAELRRRHGLSHRLVLSGAQWGGAERILDEVGKNPDAVQYTGFVEQELLPWLYAGADCIVFPSLYEGFGLPVLEAMSAGIPVVASTADAVREVAGDAALLVDPTDTAALGAAIHRVLIDPELQNDLRARGHERARAFAWEATAQRTFQVFEAARGLA